MKKLGINEDSLYTALIQDAEVQSSNWDMMGRQADAWKKYGEACVCISVPDIQRTRWRF